MAWPTAKFTHSTLLAIVVGAFFFGVYTASVLSAEPAQRPFAEVVQPFLRAYCLGCHGEKSMRPSST